jgi:hypothetical protein
MQTSFLRQLHTSLRAVLWIYFAEGFDVYHAT